jgi:glycosyltransferase involved in cell wall biosynthesis
MKKTISVLYARNFGLSKATGDWILVVDPDEVKEAAREMDHRNYLIRFFRIPGKAHSSYIRSKGTR